MAEKSISRNLGNWYRLKEKINKAEAGEDTVIGFLGGSITQGSLSSHIQFSYSYLVYDWWRNRFPKSNTHYINAGIGGTSSFYGTARVQKDLLVYNPDVVFVDFSVNDEEDNFFKETFEGVIRQIYYSKIKPAVIVLNNVFYNSGKNAEFYHNEVAAYYEIPCVSMKHSLYQNILQGKYRIEEITPDYLHPNDKGHQLIAEELTQFLDEIYKKRKVKDKETIYKKALTDNKYENAICIQNDNCYPIQNGFIAHKERKKGLLDLYKNGWIGSKVGDKISFLVEGCCIAVQYQKSIKKPVPVAQVTLDGRKEEAIILDGNFDEDWGDCLYLQSILHHGENKTHHIELEIIEASENDLRPFYLVSVIIA